MPRDPFANYDAWKTASPWDEPEPFECPECGCDKYRLDGSWLYCEGDDCDWRTDTEPDPPEPDWDDYYFEKGDY